jgi:hypothetical protein
MIAFISRSQGRKKRLGECLGADLRQCLVLTHGNV